NFPGIGGSIKNRATDFFVQEVPLYEPTGVGEHVYCEIQKVGIPTFEAIERIASALRVSPRDIGYAGLKDAKAITRQIFSILGTTEEAVMTLRVPDITIQWAARHGNKLRLGHLVGNRFAIKIRDVNPTDVVKIEPVMAELGRRGMPNYFGEQRFGRRGDNHKLGGALIRGRPEELLALLLGSPDPSIDDPPMLKARRSFSEGRFEDAMRQWPRHGGMERRVLARMIKTGKAGAAVRMIDQRLRRLWVSALQSEIFNDVLSRRMTGSSPLEGEAPAEPFSGLSKGAALTARGERPPLGIDRILTGDLAMKHENGAVFRVEDPAAEQPRADRFEISPTGPIVGHRMTLPEGEELNLEEQVLKSHGLTLGHFRQESRNQSPGARRAFRVQPKDVNLAAGVDEHGAHITVAFTLPAGSYATVLLRELMKNDAPEALSAAGEAVSAGDDEGAHAEHGEDQAE
ncbi:MAG TPA: tRNA pseudouridine(13) synthase TruD, partial [Tepidisphaeraceae bacterium]|nr:tRNA pseudouridine(13) synthase TruD [Tepidisphaeraceae bacterium]